MTRDYLPPKAGLPWATLSPAEAGFDPSKLAAAIDFARVHETSWPVDLRGWMETGCFEPPPANEILGAVQPRGQPNGIVLRHGYIVARWGDTARVDMVFSIAKSMLSLLAGLALDGGLIDSLDEPVARTIDDGGFEGPQNGTITWRHFLQQTSEWEGTLWGKSDVIDRYRDPINKERNARKGQERPLQAPGTYWEYNDVRVNRLSLALLQRFRRPLPEVLDRMIMHPIGASGDWHWEPYRNSLVEIDGRQMASVPGGGHWGGGLFIHSEDLARIALLLLRRGRWGDVTVIPETWIDRMVEPCDLNPSYGSLWWLDTAYGRTPPSRQNFYATGAGGNFCWICPEEDLAVIMRWIDADQREAFLTQVLSALR